MFHTIKTPALALAACPRSSRGRRRSTAPQTQHSRFSSSLANHSVAIRCELAHRLGESGFRGRVDSTLLVQKGNHAIWKRDPRSDGDLAGLTASNVALVGPG